MIRKIFQLAFSSFSIFRVATAFFSRFVVIGSSRLSVSVFSFAVQISVKKSFVRFSVCSPSTGVWREGDQKVQATKISPNNGNRFEQFILFMRRLKSLRNATKLFCLSRGWHNTCIIYHIHRSSSPLDSDKSFRFGSPVKTKNHPVGSAVIHENNSNSRKCQTWWKLTFERNKENIFVKWKLKFSAVFEVLIRRKNIFCWLSSWDKSCVAKKGVPSWKQVRKPTAFNWDSLIRILSGSQ